MPTGLNNPMNKLLQHHLLRIGPKKGDTIHFLN
jgi:hypothetical protein